MSSLHQCSIPLPLAGAQEFSGAVIPPETVAAMLSKQAEPDGRQSPVVELHRAIDDGDAARVRDELDACRHQSNIHAGMDFAIERAVTSGRLDILRLLIDNGVSVETGDLERAAQSGYVPVLSYLMEILRWPIDEVFDSGRTVLTLAVRHGGAVRWLLSLGASVNKEDGFSETPLSRAVQTGTQDVVKTLLDSGADVTRGAPLHASLLRGEGDVTLRLMRQLLELGAPVNKFQGEGSLIWESAGFEQMTALHLACDGVHRNVTAVRLLLAYGADPMLNRRLHGVAMPNTSALDSAIGRGYTDIVSVIHEHVSRRGDSA